MIKKIFSACMVAAAMFLAASCDNGPKMTQSQTAFTKMENPGIVVNSQYYITYDAASFQLATTSDNIYRIFSDDLTQYASIEIADEFSKVGDMVEAKVTYRKGSDGEKIMTYKMILSRVSEDNTYWFWNEDSKFGAIVRKVE